MLVLGALLGGSPMQGGYDVDREAAVSSSFVYVAFGVALVALGFAIDASNLP